MAAKDYKIVVGIFDAYIAKTQKKFPHTISEDRRTIDEQEILLLIDWYLDHKQESLIGFASHFKEGRNIIIKYE